MMSQVPISASRTFQEQLRATREKIATLPAGQRVFFETLADEAEQMHDEMQGQCAAVRNLVDDMHLQEVSASFHLWAASSQMKQALASLS